MVVGFRRIRQIQRELQSLAEFKNLKNSKKKSKRKLSNKDNYSQIVDEGRALKDGESYLRFPSH